MPLGHRTMLACALSAALVLSACSSDKSETPTDSMTGLATTPTPTPSAAASEPADEPECAVKGFVPGHAITVTKARDVIVYAAGTTLAPGSSVKGTFELDRAEFFRIRVATVKGKPVSGTLRTSILRSVGVAWPRSGPPASVTVPRNIRNDSDRNQHYYLYQAGRLTGGTWTARYCGAPYNDGTSVLKKNGRFSSLAEPGKVRLYACGNPGTQAERTLEKNFCRL